VKILIAGGSGFIGTALSSALLNRGHVVTALGRSPSGLRIQDSGRYHYVSVDTTREGEWQEHVRRTNAVINLAGKNIFSYWTQKTKSRIYESRVATTRHLVTALPDGNRTLFLSASAAGYYGHRTNDVIDETAPPGNDFLAKVCLDWEQEARRAESRGARTVTMRFGVVLGKGGGALTKMLPAYKLCLGGSIGSGRQWFPWIHLEDLLSAVHFLIAHDDVNGPVNICAPNAITQYEFAKALGQRLKRPVFWPLPTVMVKLFLGELGTALLSSQRVVPARLRDQGFSFRYPDIQTALDDII